jgi:hypothetical protein
LLEWVALFAQVQAGPEGAEQLVVLLRYLLRVGDKAAHEATGRVLNSVLGAQRAEELMRSYGDELIERGRQRGREEGLTLGVLRGRAEDILRILAVRGVHVDEVARRRILACTDVATLDRWFDKALNATTLSAVLDDLAQ